MQIKDWDKIQKIINKTQKNGVVRSARWEISIKNVVYRI